MTQETIAAPGAAAELPAPVVAETPEVASPEPAADTSQPATESVQEPTEAERDKALRAMQRRIDKRTADLYRERAKLELAERKLQEYEQRPSEEPQQDPIKLAREIARLEKVQERSNAIANEGAKAFPDFREAVVALAQEVGALYDQRGAPMPLMEAILDSDIPAKVLYHLGRNPDIAADLADLTPTQQARRIARLEVELSKPATQQVSKAPQPLTPVKSGGNVVKDESAMTDAEWIAFQRAKRNTK